MQSAKSTAGTQSTSQNVWLFLEANPSTPWLGFYVMFALGAATDDLGGEVVGRPHWRGVDGLLAAVTKSRPKVGEVGGLSQLDRFLLQ